MEFEDALEDVGSSGKYQQLLLWGFVVPTSFLLPLFTMNLMFMLSTPDHWCYVPEVATSNLTIEQQRKLISPPKDSKCLMYDVNYTDFMQSGIYVVPNDTVTKSCSMGWQYDTTNYDHTVTTQWNMVCHDEHYKSFVMTLFNVGSILLTPIYGTISDKVGRKPAFYVTVVVSIISAFASALVTNFAAFVVLRIINGGLMPSLYQLPVIIILEIVDPAIRTRMNGLASISWTLGACILPAFAYFCRNWVTLGLVTSSIMFTYFAYFKILPESPRWLVLKEKYDRALSVMERISKKNKKPIHAPTLLTKLKKVGEKIKKDQELEGQNKQSTYDLFRYRQMRKRFLIVTYTWVADIVGYYGLQLNVYNLAGNEFLNFFLVTIVEMPGFFYSWAFMEYIGRRWCTVSSMLLMGTACILPAVLPSDVPSAGLVCSMIGKFFSSAAFMATYQQSSELYPTTLRSLGMGMSSVIASLITLAVPYIPYMKVLGDWVPFLTIGLICMSAGIAGMFLPETLHKNLPQTVQDVEGFGLDQKFFGLNRHRKKSDFERRVSVSVKEKVGYISRKLSLKPIKEIDLQLEEDEFEERRGSYIPDPEGGDALEKSSHNYLKQENSQTKKVKILPFENSQEDVPGHGDVKEAFELSTTKTSTSNEKRSTGESGEKSSDMCLKVDEIVNAETNNSEKNV